MLVTGIRGKFSIKEPVSNLVDDSVLYEVTSKVPIREFNRDMGLDAKVTIYTTYGILDKYDEDVDNNIYIIGILKPGSVDVIYIPETYITRDISQEYIEYVEKILAFNIGLVPVNLDLTNLQEKLVSMLSNEIGIEVQVKEVIQSGVELVDKATHETNIMGRNNYLANDNSISKQLSDQIELNDNLQRQLEIVNIALQTKIKN